MPLSPLLALRCRLAFQALDHAATHHSPNGKPNMSFQALEERGVSVSDNHYKAHAQYHLDALHRQQERGLGLSSYHYNSLTSIYDTMATKQNAYTSETTSYTHTPSVSARSGVGGLTDAEMRNLEIKLLGRNYSVSNYSNSSSSSSVSKRPGVGVFSDEDLARLERKFESLFKKTISSRTISSISELKEEVKSIQNGYGSSIKKQMPL